MVGIFIELCRPFAIGPVNNMEQMNQLIKKTRINLSLSPEGTFHSRIGEVGQNSSFLLVYSKGKLDPLPVKDFFIEDKDIVLFKDYQEMKEKVDYYLEHKYEREAVATLMQKKVFAQFSNKFEAKKILDVVFGDSKDYLI